MPAQACVSLDTAGAALAQDCMQAAGLGWQQAESVRVWILPGQQSRLLVKGTVAAPGLL